MEHFTSKNFRAYLYTLAVAAAVLLASFGLIEWYAVSVVAPFILALLNLKPDDVEAARPPLVPEHKA